MRLGWEEPSAQYCGATETSQTAIFSKVGQASGKPSQKKAFVNDVDPYERAACERMPVFEEDDFSRYLVDIVKKLPEENGGTDKHPSCDTDLKNPKSWPTKVRK